MHEPVWWTVVGNIDTRRLGPCSWIGIAAKPVPVTAVDRALTTPEINPAFCAEILNLSQNDCSLVSSSIELESAKPKSAHHHQCTKKQTEWPHIHPVSSKVLCRQKDDSYNQFSALVYDAIYIFCQFKSCRKILINPLKLNPWPSKQP